MLAAARGARALRCGARGLATARERHLAAKALASEAVAAAQSEDSTPWRAAAAAAAARESGGPRGVPLGGLTLEELIPEPVQWDGKGMPPQLVVPPLQEGFNEDEFLAHIEQILPYWQVAWKTMSVSELDARRQGYGSLEGFLKGTGLSAGDGAGDGAGKPRARASAEPIVRVRKVDAKGRAHGTGRRKASVASVWIRAAAEKGTGTIVINNKTLFDYFSFVEWREHAVGPLAAVDGLGNFDVWCVAHGGGFKGQSGAMRLGLARALQNFDPLHRLKLKPLGMMRRDSRVVEEKKPGQHKARKKYQWVKR
jgi:small subunit ribosomal protein S9